MARPSRKPPSPTGPLLKPPTRVGNLDFAALVGELRQLHELADDPDIHRMPADEELFGALQYLEAHAGALKTADARRKASVTRVKLWQYLREQADSHQAKAVEDARSAEVEWAQLAPALAVNTASAAYNKSLRLRAASFADASHAEPRVRRTPEAVLEAERLAAAQTAAVRRAEQEAARRHRLLAPVAARLLQYRAGLDDGDDITYWLDEIEAVLPSCETPTQLVSLATYVKAVVREVRKAEHGNEYRTGMTDNARTACAAAAELLSQD
ncbi:hypothetical protein OHB41_49825 [Streptomyces sp. NBC_01571]|uniref:hypothetical protein n=1 Tax=Streptomyces sp. NBC_01571 TaxID=2975883 RepID=UPI0022545BA7|nr:hypothetical protein [Streptomyces sp. NBC_01571]MCX4581063.1 hypothetical protein [Streptomyces sp. NBC_01571]